MTSVFMLTYISGNNEYTGISRNAFTDLDLYRILALHLGIRRECNASNGGVAYCRRSSSRPKNECASCQRITQKGRVKGTQNRKSLACHPRFFEKLYQPRRQKIRVGLCRLTSTPTEKSHLDACNELRCDSSKSCCFAYYLRFPTSIPDSVQRVKGSCSISRWLGGCCHFMNIIAYPLGYQKDDEVVA